MTDGRKGTTPTSTPTSKSSTLSCCEQKPFLFLGMFMSIFALTMVMLAVTNMMWHSPETNTKRKSHHNHKMLTPHTKNE